MSEILVKLEVEQGRRFFSVMSIVGLGITLLYIAASYPPSNLMALFGLIALGGAFIWGGVRLYQATRDEIHLTREEIVTRSGIVLCKFNDIVSVDRGFFAFKPTNGFLVRLNKRGKRSWAPGLYWHLGKSIGIGGVISPRQSKEMVSIIQMMQAEKKAEEANKD